MIGISVAQLGLDPISDALSGLSLGTDVAEEGAFAGTDGALAGVGSGSGGWADGIESVAGGAEGQLTNGACVAACGAMLSGGSIDQATLLSQIGEWSNPGVLADALNSEGDETWTGGYFADEDSALAAAERGPMGAVLQSAGESAHMVVTEPLGDGTFLVRDPWDGGSTYNVGTDWIKQYVSGGVFR